MRLLVEPLEKRGMRRKGTIADHEAFKSELVSRLAYMPGDKIEALSEVVERMAGGKRRDVWPSLVSIFNSARRLHEPPFSVSRLVRSYIQSAAGDAAARGGYLVELFLWLKKNGMLPVPEYAWREIRSEAEGNARRLQIVTDRAARGVADTAEVEWMRGYLVQRERAEAIRAVIKSKTNEEQEQ